MAHAGSISQSLAAAWGVLGCHFRQIWGSSSKSPKTQEIWSYTVFWKPNGLQWLDPKVSRSGAWNRADRIHFLLATGQRCSAGASDSNLLDEKNKNWHLFQPWLGKLSKIPFTKFIWVLLAYHSCQHAGHPASREQTVSHRYPEPATSHLWWCHWQESLGPPSVAKWWKVLVILTAKGQKGSKTDMMDFLVMDLFWCIQLHCGSHCLKRGTRILRTWWE